MLFASQAAAIANARTRRNERQARADLAALVDTSLVGVVVFRPARPPSAVRWKRLSGGTCPMMPNHDHASRPGSPAVMLHRAPPIRRSRRAETTARKDGPVGRRGHDERTSETTRARLLDSRSTCRAASS